MGIWMNPSRPRVVTVNHMGTHNMSKCCLRCRYKHAATRIPSSYQHVCLYKIRGHHRGQHDGRRGQLTIVACNEEPPSNTTNVSHSKSGEGAQQDTAMASSSSPSSTTSPLVYDGIIFDMDGTLSVSCIDYQLMRQSLDIPQGDLFTVMETWDDGDRILRSMDTILEIEDVAAGQSKGMPGLEELLLYLQEHPVKVGLVTRNTEYSVNAFFESIGHDYRDVFDIIMTREFPYVKPDKRCLTHFADAWGISPARLLMVGDSTEDVECGNAAGTATCLISGGGNEITSEDDKTKPPRGTIPSFQVDSLYELQQRLEKRDTKLGWNELSLDDRAMDAGAPFQGLEFFNFMFESGAVQAPACSFPRLRSTILETDVDNMHPGDRILHLGCGDGSLTKMLFSAGFNCVGADVGTSAEKARTRGLATMAIDPTLSKIEEEIKEQMGDALFDAVVFLQDHPHNSSTATALISSTQALSSLRALTAKGTGTCIFEVNVPSNDGTAFSKESFVSTVATPSGWTVMSVDQSETTLRCILLNA